MTVKKLLVLDKNTWNHIIVQTNDHLCQMKKYDLKNDCCEMLEI